MRPCTDQPVGGTGLPGVTCVTGYGYTRQLRIVCITCAIRCDGKSPAGLCKRLVPQVLAAFANPPISVLRLLGKQPLARGMYNSRLRPNCVVGVRFAVRPAAQIRRCA